MQTETRATQEQLDTVNDGRLKKGEGWIGYRYTKKNGERVASNFLYFSYYTNGRQVFVNSKSNDVEAVYGLLRDARKHVEAGNRPESDVKRVRFETLMEILVEHYQENYPDSLYARLGEDGKAEYTFRGYDKLAQFFKGMNVNEITAMKIREYIKWRLKEGDSGATIRRQLGSLRSAFNRAKALDLLTDNNIPTFVLPADSKPRKGFLDLEDFYKFRAALPTHLQPAATFIYFTGCRSGAAQKITWGMVSKDCSEIELSAEIVKNDEPLTLPLVGPLAEVSAMLREMRKSFPKSSDRVFNFRSFRHQWNRTCHKLGLGIYDRDTRHYSGLKPHDFRRSCARNLIKAGVDRRTAMKITGHKTEHIFERYNIKTTTDVAEALLKVGQFKQSGEVAEIATTR